MGSQRVGHNCSDDLAAAAASRGSLQRESCGMRASRCRGFSRRGAWGLAPAGLCECAGAQQGWLPGSRAQA